MKRLVLFLVFITVGLAASAQQNINESLKNEALFKKLVKVKGKLLYEIDVVRKINDPDSLNRHFKYIACLCYMAIWAIDYPPAQVNCEEAYFVDDGQKGEAHKIYQVLQRLGSLANGYKYQADPLAIRKAVLSVEQDLRTAIIIY